MKMDIHAIFNFSSVAYVASGIDVSFSYFFDEVSNRQIFPSICMVIDQRYPVADPRYTISALHILPSHTFEYRAREQWKKRTLVVLLTNECMHAFGTLPVPLKVTLPRGSEVPPRVGPPSATLPCCAAVSAAPRETGQTLEGSFSAASKPTLQGNTRWKALAEIYTMHLNRIPR